MLEYLLLESDFYGIAQLVSRLAFYMCELMKHRQSILSNGRIWAKQTLKNGDFQLRGLSRSVDRGAYLKSR
jgi:hypothetical protein